MKHIPVLMSEVLDGLSLNSGDVIIDATLGLGGHTREILKRIEPNGSVIGFDRDVRNLQLAQKELEDIADRIEFVNDSFSSIESHVKEPVDGALFDIGFSSLHVDDPERGFSFMKDGPLDMRYDHSQKLTAEIIVNDWLDEDLSKLFRKLGEEQFASKISRAIVIARRNNRITRTSELSEIISSVVRRSGKSHPATKVFQALRIAVNDELGEVEKGLDSAVRVLKPGGRLVVISFHSLEDRLVKRFFKGNEELKVITKRPIKPSDAEVKENPRARSAKLRIAEKI